MAGVAAATPAAFIRAAVDDDVSVGISLSLQTQNSLLDDAPHFHALVADRGIIDHGTSVRPTHSDTDAPAEARRRGLLECFMDREHFQSGFRVDGS